MEKDKHDSPELPEIHGVKESLADPEWGVYHSTSRRVGENGRLGEQYVVPKVVKTIRQLTLVAVSEFKNCK